MKNIYQIYGNESSTVTRKREKMEQERKKNKSNFIEKERNENVITNPMSRLLRNKNKASISKVKEGHEVD